MVHNASHDLREKPSGNSRQMSMHMLCLTDIADNTDQKSILIKTHSLQSTTANGNCGFSFFQITLN